MFTEDLHVQLEEDERGFETYALSTSSSQAEVDVDSPATPTTKGRPGPRTWIFYCPSSASRSIWRTFGGSLIFVIGTEEVNANGPVKSRVFCLPAYYLLNSRQLNNLLRVQARMRRLFSVLQVLF